MRTLLGLLRFSSFQNGQIRRCSSCTARLTGVSLRLVHLRCALSLSRFGADSAWFIADFVLPKRSDTALLLTSVSTYESKPSTCLLRCALSLSRFGADSAWFVTVFVLPKRSNTALLSKPACRRTVLARTMLDILWCIVQNTVQSFLKFLKTFSRKSF